MSQPFDRFIGKQVAGYHLTALLGVGGMAKVYRAHDVELKREVALKLLAESQIGDANYVQRFRDEARRIAALTHPNIVPIYQFGDDRGALFLVMPILAESLRQRLERDPALSMQQALPIVTQIAGALAAAHAQGIVHRDVKPENILLNAEGMALLTDFGIAREAEELRKKGAKRTLSPTGLPVGTPEYMAPEQLQAHTVDHRADVYALGAVLYELITGTTPHADNSPYAVAVRVLTEPVTPPSQRNPQISPELEQVVLRALAWNPDDRYQDMTSFAEALAVASNAPVPSYNALAGVSAEQAGELVSALPLANSPTIRYPEPSLPLLNGGTSATQPALEPFAAGTNGQRGPSRKSLRFVAIALLALFLLSGTGILLFSSFHSPQSPLSSLGQGNGSSATSTSVFGSTTTAAAGATVASLQQTATVQAGGIPGATPSPLTPSAGPGTPTAPAPATATSTAVVAPQPLQLNPASQISLSRAKGSCTGSQTINNVNAFALSWQWTDTSPQMDNLTFQINGSGPSSGLPSGVLAANSTIALTFKFDCSGNQFNTITMTDDQSNTYTFSAQH